MAKRNSTKGALILSLLSMLVCISMLVGSTFAWFTDTASTGSITIKTGTLDVALLKAADNSSLEGQSLLFKDKNGGTTILWEPGATFETEEFLIKNEGDLAFKYKIQLNGTEVSNNSLMEVIKFSLIDTKNTLAENDDIVIPLSTFVGYLDAANPSSGNLKLRATMNQNAGNKYQGLSYDQISITVFATQYTYETDTYGNQYDKDAKYADQLKNVSTPDEFLAAFANLKDGDYILLAADINMAGKTWTGTSGKSFTLDGNGHKISNLTNSSSANTNVGGIVNSIGAGKSVTVTNVTFDTLSVSSTSLASDEYIGGIVGYADAASAITISKVTINNATIDSSKYAGGFIGWNSGYANDFDGPVYSLIEVSNCSITNSSITGGGSTGGVIGHAGCSKATDNVIKDVTISGNTIQGDSSAKYTGIVVGTANVGRCYISNIDQSGNKNSASVGLNNFVGRFVPVSTGILEINGATQTAFENTNY